APAEPRAPSPAARCHKWRTSGGQPVVDRGSLHAAGGLRRHGWIVAFVDEPQRLNGERATVLRICLVGVQAINIEAGDIHIRTPIDDPVCQDASNTPTGEDADRVQAGRPKVVSKFWRLADDGAQIWCEALRTAKELLDPHLQGDG